MPRNRKNRKHTQANTRNTYLKEITSGPVGGQTHRACTARLPPTPPLPLLGMYFCFIGRGFAGFRGLRVMGGLWGFGGGSV